MNMIPSTIESEIECFIQDEKLYTTSISQNKCSEGNTSFILHVNNITAVNIVYYDYVNGVVYP